jgi:hypothetical protein
MIKLDKNSRDFWLATEHLNNSRFTEKPDKASPISHKSTKEIIALSLPFIITWLTLLLFLIFILSIVSCDCETQRPAKRGNQTTVVVNNTNTFDDSEIQDRLDQLEANDNQQNTDIIDLDNRLSGLETKLNNSIVETQTSLLNLQTSVDLLQGQYSGISQAFTAQIEALNASVELLKIDLQAFKAESNSEFSQLQDFDTYISQVVDSINNSFLSFSNTTNVNIDTIRREAINLKILVNSLQLIQNNQLTIQQVQNIALSIVNGNIRFINPCGLTTRHTELVFVIGVKVYAFVVEGNARGGLAELVANLTYGSTIGCQCSFKYNVVNNQVVITKL